MGRDKKNEIDFLLSFRDIGIKSIEQGFYDTCMMIYMDLLNCVLRVTFNQNKNLLKIKVQNVSSNYKYECVKVSTKLFNDESRTMLRENESEFATFNLSNRLLNFRLSLGNKYDSFHKDTFVYFAKDHSTNSTYLLC